MSNRNMVLFGPLVVFQAYMSGTILLFAFGPWDWNVPSPSMLYGFLIAVQVAVFLGYLLAMRRRRDIIFAGQVPGFGLKWFRASLVISAFLALPTAYARTGAMIPDVVTGILRPGAVYIENFERLSDGGWFLFAEYLRIVFSIFLVSTFPLTVLYWRSISRWEKLIASMLVAFSLAIFIAVGQNKGLADLIATLAFLIVAGHLAHKAPPGKALFKASIAQAAGLIVFFTYFGMTQLLRRGGAVAGQPGSFGWSTSVLGSSETEPGLGSEPGSERGLGSGLGSEPEPGPGPGPGPGSEPGLGPEPGPGLGLGPETEAVSVAETSAVDPGSVTAYPDHIVAQLAPDFVRNVYESFARYLGQGYQALALSFDLEHSLTLGFGNSMFLARNADRVFGTDFFVSHSLPGILESETGWSMFHLWHSIYPWIASDVGFLGTFFVMGVLGFLLARAWINTIATLDPIWGTLLYLLIILFFYIPANNQIMQSGETASAFVIFLGVIAIRGIYRKIGSAHGTDHRIKRGTYPPT